MESKKQVLRELSSLIREHKLTRTEVGLAISGSKSFMDVMEDPTKSITTRTIDRAFKYILEKRGQLSLEI